jgi:hypothetical protein
MAASCCSAMAGRGAPRQNTGDPVDIDHRKLRIRIILVSASDGRTEHEAGSPFIAPDSPVRAALPIPLESGLVDAVRSREAFLGRRVRQLVVRRQRLCRPGPRVIAAGPWPPFSCPHRRARAATAWSAHAPPRCPIVRILPSCHVRCGCAAGLLAVAKEAKACNSLTRPSRIGLAQMYLCRH